MCIKPVYRPPGYFHVLEKDGIPSARVQRVKLALSQNPLLPQPQTQFLLRLGQIVTGNKGNCSDANSMPGFTHPIRFLGFTISGYL